MRPVEMMIWSAAAGSIGLIVLLALADVVYSRSRASLYALVYLTSAWFFVVLLSGLPGAVLHLPGDSLHWSQVLIGPWCAGIGSYGASLWLSAHKRDKLMKVSLHSATVICLAFGPLCLLLQTDQQLPASACLTMVGLGLSLWLSVRAAQLGDRMAWGLAAGSLLTLPLQIGMYWLALGNSRPSALWQAGMAMAGLSSLTVTAIVIWLRNRHEQQIHHDGQSRRDPITQLYSSLVMVQKIIRAQKRLVRTRRDGALMAVLVFAPEALAAQVGQYGLNEIYIQLARRMQRQTGVVNPAGRYYDRCFIVVVETMHSPRWIRTLGLRVASSLRRPIDVTSLAGERIQVTADIGVGLVMVSAASRNVDHLLHEAQRVAEAAREMRSRAALLDPDTRQPVPVESAELGTSWRNLRALQADAPSSLSPASSSSSHSSLHPSRSTRPARLQRQVKPARHVAPLRVVRNRGKPA